MNQLVQLVRPECTERQVGKLTTTTFVVTRQSTYGEEDSPPVPEAFRSRRKYVDYRTFANDAVALQIEPYWYEKGAEHRRSEGGGMQRTLGEQECWLVDLETLDALLSFVEEHGVVVIQRPSWNRKLWELEVRDL